MLSGLCQGALARARAPAAQLRLWELRADRGREGSWAEHVAALHQLERHGASDPTFFSLVVVVGGWTRKWLGMFQPGQSKSALVRAMSDGRPVNFLGPQASLVARRAFRSSRPCCPSIARRTDEMGHVSSGTTFGGFQKGGSERKLSLYFHPFLAFSVTLGLEPNDRSVDMLHGPNPPSWISGPSGDFACRHQLWQGRAVWSPSTGAAFQRTLTEDRGAMWSFSNEIEIELDQNMVAVGKHVTFVLIVV